MSNDCLTFSKSVFLVVWASPFQPEDRKTHSMDLRRVNLRVKWTSVKVWWMGRAKGRIGVHVESEVVLKCEGNNNEGACDMLC